MQEVEKSLDSLIGAVKNSDVYLEYLRCERALAAIPELKERVDNYRYESSKLRVNEINEELSQYAAEVDKEGRMLYKIPEAGAYLSAELALCRMVQHTCEKLVGSLEFTLPTER